MILEAGLIGFRFLHYVAVLSLFGASFFPLYAYRGALGSRFVWLRRVLLLSVLVVFVSLVGWFAFTAGAMAGTIAGITDPTVLLSVIESTEFGLLWIARLVVAAIIAALLLRWPSAPALRLLPLFAMLLLVSLAGTGHARVTQGWAGALHVAADAAHLLAAGAWIGGLWLLSFVTLNGAHDDTDDNAIGDVLLRFSGVGYVAVATLVASGLINSWFLVGSPSALISSTYGWLLITKVSAFLGMVLLAVANRFWITPQIGRANSSSDGRWLRRLRRHVVAEQALGLFVLAIVSFLGTMETPVPA